MSNLREKLAHLFGIVFQIRQYEKGTFNVSAFPLNWGMAWVRAISCERAICSTSTYRSPRWRGVTAPVTHLLIGVRPRRLARMATSFELALRLSRFRTFCCVSGVQKIRSRSRARVTAV